MRIVKCGLLGAAVLILFWIVGACDNVDSTAPESNVPPSTTISGGPKVFAASSYLVDLKWFGIDVDGSIDGYEYAWDDTTEWYETVLTGSTFVVSSDTCCLFDTLKSSADLDSIVERFFRYHTFFVRSFDNKEARDPSPAHITFNSTTVAPSSKITQGPPENASSGRAVSIHWEGFDPDSPDNSVAAYEYFHATKGRLREQYGYVDGPGVTKKVWNKLDWIRVGGDTTNVVLRGLETGFGVNGSNRHIFFIRSIDDAGAVEQLPVKGINYREWGASNDAAGGIVIRTNVMGTGGSNNVDRVGEIFEGTRVVFSWQANLGSYDGVVTGYGHAYDNLLWSAWDLGDTRFPKTGDFIPLRGRHSFFSRARDEAGQVVTAEFPFEVYSGPINLDTTRVLLLSNFHIEANSDFYPTPTRYQRFWTDSVLVNYNYEYYDPRVAEESEPPIRRMSQATTIILPTDDWEGSQPPLMAEWHKNQVNPIWSYVDAGGNLLLLGFMPAWNFLPDNDFLDTGVVPQPNPCYSWSSPKSCGSSLIWYHPLLADSFPHPLYEYCALETTWLDESADYLWGADAQLPNLPDLHIDSLRSKNFQRRGLWNSERLTYRKDRGAIPIYDYSRTANPLTVTEPADRRAVGIWIPSDGVRGHVVYLGMPVYFFRVPETRNAIETILGTLFGEDMRN